jgi:hypothetical protein
MKKSPIIIVIVLLTSIAVHSNSTNTEKWSDFAFPAIDVVDKDKVSEGVLIFHRLVPNPDSLFRSCIIEVCKVLYKDKAEVPVKTAFKFNLRNSQGVAATGGNLTGIDMFMNTNYIADFYNRHNKSDEETLSEITGIIIHELTHAYQYSPKGDGGYVNNSEHFSCIEGIADVIRLKTGYVSSEFKRPGGHWNDGYKVTAFFIDWITSLDEDFIYKIILTRIIHLGINCH